MQVAFLLLTWRTAPAHRTLPPRPAPSRQLAAEVLLMLAGVALPLLRLSATQLIRHKLTRRVHERLGVLEVQFLSRDADRLLPVLLDGELLILRWGNRRGESASLPCTWTQLATVEAGGWASANVVDVVIPASLAVGLRDLGAGHHTTVIRGLAVADEQAVRHVYPILEPASPYYATMTKSAWMPWLVERGL